MATSAGPPSTTANKVGSLKDALSAALSERFQGKVRYVHTAPKRCNPIFSAPPDTAPEVTRLACHFLTISIKPDLETTKSESDVFVLGIEALIYTTKRLTTIFVSKADSTGYLPKKTPSVAKTIITTFVHWLARNEQNRHPTRKLVISLFARSQSQYLFPGSAENAGKHILDDRQLIRWWIRVLDPIFSQRDEAHMSNEALGLEYRGYITVPGYDGISELRRFLPIRNSSHGVNQHWTPGNPLKELAQARGLPENAPTRCLLPRFPDDPKARFIQDLDDEVGLSEDAQSATSPKKKTDGRWKTIRDLDRFWEAMSFRQECSSGRVVGFIWLVIGPQGSSTADLTEESAAQSLVNDRSSDPVSQGEVPMANGRSPRKRRKLLTGPIIPRQPRLKGGSSSLTASDLSGMVNGETSDGLLLTQDGYDKAMHSLLHLDFANIEVAVQSTKKWIAEVSHICGIQTDWALEITGTAMSTKIDDNGASQATAVNDLGGMIRKKRKAEDQAVAGETSAVNASSDAASNEQTIVNVLGAGMIRKKPKPVVT